MILQNYSRPSHGINTEAGAVGVARTTNAVEGWHHADALQSLFDNLYSPYMVENN